MKHYHVHHNDDQYLHPSRRQAKGHAYHLAKATGKRFKIHKDDFYTKEGFVAGVSECESCDDEDLVNE